MTDELRVEWKCPNCDAPANHHGKGGREKCKQSKSFGSECNGFICECGEGADVIGELHGETFSDVCAQAYCYHCDWSGVFPKKPKSLTAWEKHALEAGWTPPEKRRKELGI